MEDLIIKEFLEKEKVRVLSLYSASKHKISFLSNKGLWEWFEDKLIAQNFCCYYCGTSIFEINKLIDTDI